MSEFKVIVITDRQTLADIAVQEYGCCVPGMALLLKDNEGKLNSWNDVPKPGITLRVRKPVPRLTDTNKAVALWYAEQHQQVVSGNEALPDAPVVELYTAPQYVDDLYLNDPVSHEIAIHGTWENYIKFGGNGNINAVSVNLNNNNG